MSQGPSGGISAPPTVEAGSPIPVDVQLEGVGSVTVTTLTGSDGTISVPVGEDGSVLIPPNPNWHAGSIILITTADPPYVTVIVELVPPSE